MVEAITTVLLKSAAPTVFKEITAFIRNKYSEYSVLNNLSEDNHELVSSISKFMFVKTLATGSDIPVNLYDFFQKPKLCFNDKLFYINHIDEIKSNIEIENYNNFVFEGTVGQGKSIFLRSLAIHDFINNSRIPIFIELKNVSKNNSLVNLIREYLKVWIGTDEELLKLVLKSGKVSLFLDAFDEVDLDLIEDTHTTIDGLVKSYPNLKVIVSSRPDTIILQNSNFYTISLCPYTIKEQEGLINKIVNDPENKRLLIDSIKVSSFEVRKVLTTPLMVILYIKQYEVGFSVPQHVSDFYKNIFDVVTFTHDKSKGIEKRKSFSSLNQNQLEKVFQRFCFESFLIDKTVFDKKLFIELLEKSLKRNSINIEIDFSDLIHDFTRFACLILKDGLKYTFIHKSIQEYYVSNFIADLPEIRAEEVVKKKLLEKSRSYLHRGNNIVDFLEIIKPYYYMKYYFMGGIELYSNEFDLNFYSDEENFKKFMGNIYIVEDRRKEDSDGIHLGVLFGGTDVFYKLSIVEIRRKISKLVENGILENNTLFLMNKSYFDIRIIFNNNEMEDNEKEIATKILEVINDKVLIQDFRKMWENICNHVKKIEKKILDIESSVLLDDFDM